MYKSILIVGGTRGTGLEVAKTLNAKGTKVSVLARPTASTDALNALNIPVLEGDAFERASLDKAFSENNFDAVISGLGGSRAEKRRVDYEGTKNVVDAMSQAGIKRFLMLGAIGTGDSRNALSEKGQQILGAILDIKGQAEDYVRDSTLDYTIIRGGAITDEPATGKGFLSEDRSLIGTITRADWAALTVEALNDPKTVGGTYAALDKDMIGVTFF